MSTAPEERKGWIGVDLDGTLAHYDGWKGPEHIGEPIKPMLDRVKKWIEEGKDVRIFTARVWHDLSVDSYKSATTARFLIEDWCKKHVGKVLPITCEKNYGMIELWDDRAIGVILNRGISHETIVALSLHRVLLAAGLQVKDGTGYAEAADLAVHRIGQIRKRFDDVSAFVDAANDALSYVIGDDRQLDDLTRAKATLAKAVALLKQEI